MVYASAWLKCHHPAEFLAALLNSQPLGFYSPRQLVRDAIAHGVEVRRVDVMHSAFDATLEDLEGQAMLAIRLGLRLVDGLKEACVERIMAARAQRPFDDADDLARRAQLEPLDMKRLAAADALMSLSGHRRQQVWDAGGWLAAPELLRAAPIDEDYLELPLAPEGEEVLWDYASLGLTLRSHPLALIRDRLRERRLSTAAELHDLKDGAQVRHAGIVTVRQQPETASGVTFVSLEDETGDVQVVVWRDLLERRRNEVVNARLLAVKGRWQREGEVRNLIAADVQDLTPLLGTLETCSRDFL